MRKLLSTRFLTDFVLLFFIALTGFFLMRGMFAYSLWGDDWLDQYLVLRAEYTKAYFELFFSLYGGQYLFIYLVKSLFGLEPQYYYYTSYMVRFICSVSIYFFSYYLTKNKLVAFMSGMLFISSYSGMESSNWVHNSVNYVAISLMLGGLWLLFEHVKTKQLFSFKLFFSYSLLTLAMILAAVRIHGFFLMYPFLELFFLLTGKTAKLGIFLRFVIWVVIYQILKSGYLFGAVDNYILGMAQTQGVLGYIKQDPINIVKAFLMPIGTFGNLFLPITFGDHPVKNYLESSLFIYRKIFYISLPLIVLAASAIKITGRKISFGLVLVFQILFLLLVKDVYNSNLGDFGLQIVIGGVFLFFFIAVALLSWYQNFRQEGLLILFFLIWSVSFIASPHAFLTPSAPIDPFARYLTFPVAAVALLVPYSIWVLFKIFFAGGVSELRIGLLDKFILGIVVIGGMLILFELLLLNHIISIDKFYQQTNTSRLNTIVRPLWDSINEEAKKYPYQGRVRMFFFMFDDPSFYQSQIGYGGTYRFAVENNIPYSDRYVLIMGQDTMFFMEQAFNDPITGVKHFGQEIESNFSLSDVVGFRVTKGKITGDTENVRQYLMTHLYDKKIIGNMKN